jgi:hypothetical protein
VPHNRIIYRLQWWHIPWAGPFTQKAVSELGVTECQKGGKNMAFRVDKLPDPNLEGIRN